MEVTDQQRHNLKYRTRLNFDAGNETEWGTLRSQIRLQGDLNTGNSDSDGFSSSGIPGDGNVGVDRVLISLAGFQMGYADDYWNSVGEDGYYEAAYDGYYDDSQGIFLDYTYAANGYTATVGAVDNRRSGTAGQPDFYAGSTYSDSWGRIFGTYHYDSSEAAGAWNAGAELNLSDYIPGGEVKGRYMSDDGDTNYVKGHAWGLTAHMNLSENIILFAGYSGYDCSDNAGCANWVDDNSSTQWTAVTRWIIASGLYFQVEYAKTNFDHQKDGRGITSGTSLAGAKARASRLSSGTVQVRVLRSF